ncbi:MAG: hypothetical protein HQL57_03090 [Magnetococcales bacterium]|nr:hypothetical protein [Magnetococcales bacterium]MBF0156155.1 hypothetical protein [Magnetococcales bacterium]
MVCGIDTILADSRKSTQEAVRRLILDLATDFDLEVDPGDLAGSPEVKALEGALESFAVWLVHGRRYGGEQG